MQSGIYEIKCLPTGKRYIGSSNNISRRWQEHKYRLNKGFTDSIKLLNAWNKYGETAFIFSVLETCPVDLLEEREQFYVDLYQPDLNIVVDIKRRISPMMHSEEARQKISAANKGKTLQPYQIEALRKANLGKKVSKETRAKLSATHTGAIFTEERKRKISESKKKTRSTVYLRRYICS